MKIKSLIQAAVISLGLVSISLGSVAFAGSGPGGPAPIVAPAGFKADYAAQASFVESTCSLESTGPQVFRLAQRVFRAREANLDHRLRRAGQSASPTYFDFANQPGSHCPKG